MIINENKINKSLLIKAQEGDLESIEKIYIENKGLIYYVILHYQNAPYDMNDLFQEGAIALLKAIKTYDDTKNTKFSTYAIICIQNALKTALPKLMPSMKISYNDFKLLKQFAMKELEFLNEYERDITKEEMANTLNKNNKAVERLSILSSDVYSLNQTVESKYGYDAEKNEFLISDFNTEDIVIAKLFRNEFRYYILNSRLTKKEKTILLLRYGFIDNHIYLLDEIASIFGVSFQAIQKSEIKALQKLRCSSSILQFINYTNNVSEAYKNIEFCREFGTTITKDPLKQKIK